MRRRGGRGPAVALPKDHCLDVDEVTLPFHQLLQPQRRVLELRAIKVDHQVEKSGSTLNPKILLKIARAKASVIELEHTLTDLLHAKCQEILA